jgi:hypothetical protein
MVFHDANDNADHVDVPRSMTSHSKDRDKMQISPSLPVIADSLMNPQKSSYSSYITQPTEKATSSISIVLQTLTGTQKSRYVDLGIESASRGQHSSLVDLGQESPAIIAEHSELPFAGPEFLYSAPSSSPEPRNLSASPPMTAVQRKKRARSEITPNFVSTGIPFHIFC